MAKDICSKCNERIEDESILISCTSCHDKRHALCAKIDPALAIKKRWWCRKCVKRDDRPTALGSSSALAGNWFERVSAIVRPLPSSPPPVPPTSRDPAFFKKAENYVQADGDNEKKSTMKTGGNADPNATGGFEKLTQLEEQIKSLQASLHDVSRKNLKLQDEFSAYKLKVEAMEQWNRRNAVEIWGIPTTENEDLMKLTERIFNAIKWTVSIKDQLDNVVRIPKSDEEFAIGKKIVKLSGPSVPKSVLWINFLSGRGKDAFVNHWKSVERNGRLTLTQLGFRQDGQVKMESSLTSNKLKLFQKALEHAKKFQYRRVGVLNGEVYLLRDSRSGPLVYVKSTQELEEMEIAEGTDGRKTLKIAENSSRTTDVY